MSGTEDKSRIVIRNVYYMLTYAFRFLEQTKYEKAASARFENAENLLAAILAIGVAQQIKQGLHREYVEKHETMPVIRGKLDLPATIRNRIRRNPKAACEFDELLEDSLHNRVLKTTMKALLRTAGVEQAQKTDLKKNLVFFDGVGELPELKIPRNRLRFERNNRNYKMLIHICEMILKGMVQTTDRGECRLAQFEEKNMPWVYENFILEYYRRTRPDLNPAHTQVRWDFQGEVAGREQIPDMKTDITLRKDGKTLIIDAKYYGHILKASRQNAQKKLPSANLYQIFAYVKNMDREATGNVSGLLLYAKTNELDVPKCKCNIGGNQIEAKTLDLDCDFEVIKRQLDEIAIDIFGPLPAGNA